MADLVNHNRNGYFIKHIATLLTGTAFSQILLIILSPVLTRIYSPEDFGTLSVFVAIVGILSTVVTLRYEMAIPLPKEEEEARLLLYVSLFFGCCLSLVIGLTLSLLSVLDWVEVAFIEKQGWCLLLFLVLCSKSINQSFNYWMTREKKFKSISLSKISNSAVSVPYQIVAELAYRFGSINLFFGYLLGNVTETVTLLSSATHSRKLNVFKDFRRIRWLKIKDILSKYRDMPKYMFQTSFLNSVSSNFLPLALTYSTDFFWAGITIMAQRIVLTPVSFLISSTWQVTHARLGELNNEARVNLFYKVHKSVAWLYALPLSMCATFSYLSDDFLGQNWKDLELILPAISLMVYMSAVSNSTSYFLAFGYFKEEAIANIYLTTMRLGSILISSVYLGPSLIIKTYALASALSYLTINIFWGLKFDCVFEFLFRNIFQSLSISLVLAFTVKWIFLSHGIILGSLSLFLFVSCYYLVLSMKILPDVLPSR